MTRPTANHIHTNTMDLIAPLRGANRKLNDYMNVENDDDNAVATLGCLAMPELGGLAFASNSVVFGPSFMRFADDVDALLTHYEALLNDGPDEDGWYPTVTLTEHEIGILSPCLLEAIRTAWAEGFTNRPGSVIQTMGQLYNEINAGRTRGEGAGKRVQVTLVFGMCPACWPNRAERNHRPDTATERRVSGILTGRNN